MGKAGGIIAIIAGIFGVLAAMATLFFGGLSSAFEVEGAGTVIGLGWGGVLFSFLSIVFGAIAFYRPKGAGIGLIVVSILGAILGGTLVAICMVLSLIGGILAVAGSGKPQASIHPETQESGSSGKTVNKKSYWLWLVIIALIAIIGIMALLSSDSDKSMETLSSNVTPKNEIEQKNNQDDMGELDSFSSVDIASAYEANTVAADQVFKEKRFRVSGTITDINTDLMGDAYITMPGVNEYFEPQFAFDKDALPQLASLRKGMTITLVCTGRGDIAKTPMSDSCVLAPPEVQTKSNVDSTVETEKPPAGIDAQQSVVAESEIDCGNLDTQSDINQCVSEALDAETSAINSVYNRYRATLDTAGKEQLKQAELAWIKNKDLTCKFEASSVEGGSMHSAVLGQCLIKQTKERRAQLESLLRCDAGITPGTNCAQ